MGDNLPYVDLGTNRTATALTSGETHNCAILDNGDLKCWGRNEEGSLGLGSMLWKGDEANEMADFLPAVSLGSGLAPAAVTLGQFFTCALLDDATTKCWGLGASGQLGTEGTASLGDGGGEMGDALPVASLGSGRTVLHLAAGENFSCAILDNNRVKCWGLNTSGELGIGATDARGDGPGEMGDGLPAVSL